MSAFICSLVVHSITEAMNLLINLVDQITPRLSKIFPFNYQLLKTLLWQWLA